MPDWEAFLRRELQLPKMEGHRDERVVRELADHLDEVYREALIRGRSEAEAEAEALRALGEIGSARTALAHTEPRRTVARVGRWFEGREVGLRGRGSLWGALADALLDARLTVRSLLKRPLFASTVVVVLGVGIGATTAIFALVDHVVLTPLPFDEQDRLVSIGHTVPDLGIDDAGQTAAWHFTYQEEARSLESIGLYAPGSVAVTGLGDPEALTALYVTAGVERALRLTPALGRGFAPGDEVVGAPNGLWLSHAYWQSRFGGVDDVLGRTLTVDGVLWEVVGVTPDALRGVGFEPDLILPLRYDRSEVFVGNIGMHGVARLQDGVSIEDARADLTRVLPLAWETFRGGPVDQGSTAPIVTPLSTEIVGSAAAFLWTLLGGVTVILLISFANVANLFLIRADGKETEMAVRSALGASRGRIGWEYLRESLLLGALGGMVGWVVASLALRGLAAIGPAELPTLPRGSLSPPVLGFIFAASLTAGCLLGALAGVRSRATRSIDALRGRQGAGARRFRRRLLDGLAIGQLALALVLLGTSGLMLRTLQSLRAVDPGFSGAEAVQVLRLDIPDSEVPDLEDAAQLLEQVALRLADLPGVSSVGMATAIPLDGANNVNPFYAEGVGPAGDAPRPMRRHKWVGGSYFETLGIRVLAGRTLTWDDVRNRLPAAVVSERLALETWGSVEAALGARVSSRPDPAQWYEVVGVVADVHDDGPHVDAPAMVYWPQVTRAFWSGTTIEDIHTWRYAGYAVRSDRVGSPDFLDDIRAAVGEVVPAIPVRGFLPLDELVRASLARSSFALTLLSVAAAVALLLGVVSVYGVISYAVSQQTREFGVRVAVGAQASDVRRLVLRRGIVIALAGVALGVALTVGASPWIEGLLYEVESTDPVTLAGVSLLLVAVAMVASYLPARRASQVDPMDALRTE